MQSKKKRKYTKKSPYWNNLSKSSSEENVEIIKNHEPVICGNSYYDFSSQPSCGVGPEVIYK